VTTLDELAQALQAGSDIVLLDNMKIGDVRKAVAMMTGRALLEASGGVTLETVATIAATGVDLISVRALTHSARSRHQPRPQPLGNPIERAPHGPDSQRPVPHRHGNMAHWPQSRTFYGISLYVLSQRIAVSDRVR
jgi:hypothetical protein